MSGSDRSGSVKGLCGPRGCHNYGLVRGWNWVGEWWDSARAVPCHLISFQRLFTMATICLLAWGSFPVVGFVQPHPPLLILNTESEKLKTAMGKFPLGYLVLPRKAKTTIKTTKICISMQTSRVVASPFNWFSKEF